MRRGIKYSKNISIKDFKIFEIFSCYEINLNYCVRQLGSVPFANTVFLGQKTFTIAFIT